MLRDAQGILEIRRRIPCKFGSVVPCDACIIDKQLDTVRLFDGNFVNEFSDLVLSTDITGDTSTNRDQSDISAGQARRLTG